MINYIKDKLEDMKFESKEHVQRLKKLSLMIADKLGLSEIEKEELRLLCEYHDIGEIGIPSRILNKKEPLSKSEWKSLRRHSEIGYYIIGGSRETLAINELILMHHERWDGKGYPGLLKGKEIPIIVRIFTIVDAYEAMTSERPYKSGMKHADALKEIESKAGAQFDPAIAKTFVDLMKIEKIVV
jgi:HD-GYP domain-containing protein (c-di-GMP phosphodiesterase class II)